MRVLYVCTANICRSASAQALLRGAVEGSPGLTGIDVRSAGTAAPLGSPGCSVAPALVGHAAEHRSQPVTAELIEWADLILPAARDHRGAIAELAPAARSRMFTLRQAGRIADWLVEAGMVTAARERAGVSGAGAPERRGAAVPGAPAWADGFPEGDLRADVQALPVEPSARLEWLLSEMDAARGMATASPDVSAPAGPAEHQGRRFGLRRRASRSAARGDPAQGEAAPAEVRAPARQQGGRSAPDPDATHPDDVPDPHVLGMGLHPLAYEQIKASTDSFVRLLVELGQ